MNYTVEVFDPWGRRIARWHDVPLLEARRTAPDGADAVLGLLPTEIAQLGVACRVRVYVEGALFCEAPVRRTGPQWGDTKKLILEKYVPFHEIVEVDAATEPRPGNRSVSRAYTNREISAIVRDLLNAAPGPIHYTVAHTAYPDGAQREFAKFLARKTPENELGVGGIDTGQWVAADRIDASAAYAKDGDTIAGLVVDGQPWPDVRLMMIDCEETSPNSHAVKRHPEVAFWSAAQYDASGYRRKAAAAAALLEQLLTTHGIAYIELNPHRSVAGAFDDRVDAYGRYIAFVYGAGQCFNAAMVEHGLADVYLYEDGKYHVPEMQLKDFFSYTAPSVDSIAPTGAALAEFDVTGGVLEVLTALAAAAGFVFRVEHDLAVHFHRPELPQHVITFDPRCMAVRLGVNDAALANFLIVTGNPFTGAVNQTSARGDSIDEYGLRVRALDYFSISRAEDAGLLAQGLLDDLAYPAPDGWITFFHGRPGIAVGDLIELRGAPVRRLARTLDTEYAGRFHGRTVARVCEVRHRFSGTHVATTVFLTSPLRSVADPLAFIVRGQDPASSLFGFRLDDATVGLDLGFHLD